MRGLLFISFICAAFLAASGNTIIEWRFQTNGRVNATPIIHNDTLLVGSLSGFLYAINATTGEELWSYNTNNEIRSTAAISGGIVCVESGNVLYGINLKGELMWTDTLYQGSIRNSFDQWDVYRSSPEIYNNVAYIGTEEGIVIGVDIALGQRVFEVQTPQADAVIKTPPAIKEGRIYVGDWFGVLSAFDLETEGLLWQYDTKNDTTYSGWVNAIISKPLIVEDKIYFGGRSCNVFKLDIETGTFEARYQSPTDQWLYGGPVIDENILYTGSSYQERVFAFNPISLDTIWSVDIKGLSYGDPLVVGEHIIVGSGNRDNLNGSGALTIVNKNSQQIDGRINVGGWVHSPTISGDRIYFGSADGFVYAVSKTNLIRREWPSITIERETPDLGALDAGGSAEVVFTITNNGLGTDSINLRTPRSYVDIAPSNFLLLPDSTHRVQISINTTGLDAEDYSVPINLISNWSMFEDTYTQTVNFSISEVTSSAQDQFWGSKNALRSFPNPASSGVTIEYQLNADSDVLIELYDIMGRKVMDIVNQRELAGSHSVKFDVSGLSNGIFAYRLHANNETVSGRLIVAGR